MNININISSKLLIDNGEYLNDNTKALLILSLLHKNNIISDNKLKGQLKQLRSGKLLTYRNTHKSGIDGKWHNDEKMIYILYDIYYGIFNNNKLKSNTIELIEMIEYVRLYINVNHNKCLDFIFKSFIQPRLIYDKYRFLINIEIIRECIGIDKLELPIKEYVPSYMSDEEYDYNRGYYDCKYEYKCIEFNDNMKKVISSYFNNLKK